jgi:hypothetical protein
MLFYIKHKGGDPRNHNWLEVDKDDYIKASKKDYFKKEVEYAKQESEDKEKREEKTQ